jgi:alkylation response protein AidB-like acyl-CoA dehydrogenase
MDFSFTEEQQIWYQTVNDFMDKEVGREYTRQHDADRAYPFEAYKKIADQGWLGLMVPEEYGGLGADALMYAIFCEAMGKFSLDFGAGITMGMFTATNIYKHGSAEQKKLLPGFLTGDVRFSVSITEPNAGSDAANTQTTAVLEGDEWVIKGQKVFSSGAQLPNNIITLVARTAPDKHEGISLILVPNMTPGVEIRMLPVIVRRSLGTNEIFFTNVRVPKKNLLGEVNCGWHYLGEHLEIERLSLAATYVGNAQTALADSVKYANGRTQFGKQLSKFQVLRHRLAEDQCLVDAARLLMYRAAWMIATGKPAVKEVSMAKVYAANAAFHVAFNGMQLLGGYAQLPDYDMERYFREAKHAMVGGGTNEIQYSIIAKQMGL